MFKRFFVLVSFGAGLVGCGSSQVTPPATPSVPTRSTLARVTAIPLTTPPPVHRAPGKGAHTPVVLPGKGHVLPTQAPKAFPTPTIIPATMYTAILRGSVTDRKTNAPIAGATLTLGVAGSRIVRSDTTGHYSVRFPAGPVVSVEVRKQGYLGALSVGRINPHARQVLNFQLVRNDPQHSAAPQPPSNFGSIAPPPQKSH